MTDYLWACDTCHVMFEVKPSAQSECPACGHSGRRGHNWFHPVEMAVTA